jgi:hypothetical protein
METKDVIDLPLESGTPAKQACYGVPDPVSLLSSSSTNERMRPTRLPTGRIAPLHCQHSLVFHSDHACAWQKHLNSHQTRRNMHD